MLVNTVSSVVLGAKYVNGSKYDVILQLPGEQERPKLKLKVLNEFLPMAPRMIDFINPTPLFTRPAPHQTIDFNPTPLFITCPRNISNC